jgi:hypothetical protein
MNERIRQLAEQVGFGPAWFDQRPPGYPASPREGMLDKFAELIIEDCRTVINEVYHNTPLELRIPLLSADEEILKRFYGVEE